MCVRSWMNHKLPDVKKGMRIELLAPAGSPEAGYAALHYGADAVYLGLSGFSARAGAVNFSAAELAEVTGYAHSLPKRRKIYAAVNTLVLQKELDSVIDLLADIAALGIDAVIVQDFGVLNILRKYFPQIKIHASTQMAIHNRQGVEAAAEMGIGRVTLARELTIAEIAGIAAVPGMETEVFVHGALCYSYSGLCLFSSHLHGRSGNRGRCAYPCREWFNPGGFIFSMKDLALGEYVSESRSAGVTALKIEGRMKSPLYVAAAVNYYRKLIDGTLKPGEEQQLAGDLKTIFSRPWTDLYLRNRKNRNVIDPEIVGHRGFPTGRVEKIVKSAKGHCLRFKTGLPLELHDGLQIDIKGAPRPFGFAVKSIYVQAGHKEQRVFSAPAGSILEIPLPRGYPEIPSGAVVYASSSQRVKQKYGYFAPKPGQYRPRQKADFAVKVDAAGFSVSAAVEVVPGIKGIPVPVDVQRHFAGRFEQARDIGRVDAALESAFSKLGDTNLKPGELAIDNPDKLFVPVSLLNAARREITAVLERKILEIPRNYAENIKIALSHLQKPENPPRPSAVAQGAMADKSAITPLEGPFPPIKWSIKTDQPHLLETFRTEDWKGMDEIIIELPAVGGGVDPACPASKRPTAIDRLIAVIGRDKIRFALPVILREWEMENTRRTAKDLISRGWKRWQVANLGGLTLLRDIEAGLDISADWPVYAMNRMAVLQLKALGMDKFTLSPEDGLENMRSILSDYALNAVVIVYQDTPLMISETCVFAVEKCPAPKICGRREALFVSPRGDRIRVVNRACRNVVLNVQPFSLAAHLDELASAGALNLRADFMCRAYSENELLETWRRLHSGAKIAWGQTDLKGHGSADIGLHVESEDTMGLS